MPVLDLLGATLVHDLRSVRFGARESLDALHLCRQQGARQPCGASDGAPGAAPPQVLDFEARDLDEERNHHGVEVSKTQAMRRRRAELPEARW